MTLDTMSVYSGAQSKVLLGHTQAVSAVALSRNGRWLVSSSVDETLRVWDFPCGNLQRVIEVSGPVIDIAFSPTQDMVALGFSSRVEVWDVASWRLVWQPSWRKRRPVVALPTRLAFSSDGALLACSMAQFVRVWDVATRQLKLILEHDDFVTSVVFSPDGRCIASGSQDETVQVWDVVTGEPQHLFQGHRDWVRDLDFTFDSMTIVSASDDGTLRLWDPSNGIVRCIIEYTHWYTAVAISPCGYKVLAGSTDATVQVYDVRTGRRDVCFGHTARINTVRFSQDAKYVISGSDDGSIRIWNAERKCKKLDSRHCAPVAPFRLPAKHVHMSGNPGQRQLPIAM